MSNYIAIIGDLIDSKKIENRKAFQIKLQDSLREINKEFEDIIVSNFTLTIGDEFQALVKLDKRLILLLDKLFVYINYDFRLGIGYGEISTKINPDISIGADGEAFWRAREAIEYVYTNNYNGRCNIFFISDKGKNDELINTLFLLSETLKYEWTDLQRETFSLMIEDNIFEETFNQKEFANKLGISQSSLSKRLLNGNIKMYIKSRLLIGEILEDIDE